MAYVPVPKDFSKIKTKLALNLTKRQIICFSLAGICGVPVYLLTKAGLGTDVAATLMIIVMLPFFFFAMYEKDGFPAEKILLHIIRQIFYHGKNATVPILGCFPNLCSNRFYFGIYIGEHGIQV